MDWLGILENGIAKLRAASASRGAYWAVRPKSAGASPSTVQAPQSLADAAALETARAGASSVIRTISSSGTRRSRAPGQYSSARRSHVSASLVMALFVGGSGVLSIVPELPNAQNWLLPHATPRIALVPAKPAAAVVAASFGGSPETLIFDALRPNLADDLTQAQAMPETETVTVKAGDTLSELLTEAGASDEDAHAALVALKTHFDPRRIQAGQDVELTLAPPADTNDDAPDEASGSRGLLGFTLQTDLTTHISVQRDEAGGYTASVTQEKLIEQPVRAVATINSSLFMAAADVGIPDSIIVDLIRLYSYDVDFQREIQKGDSFEVYFTRMVTEKGDVVQSGRILYAALTTGGQTHELWRYTAKNDGVADYYDESGRSARKFLMRTPVDGAHLTSGYGMRRHPILGYTKMHKGVDFGAPAGTPVMAAGSGIVEYAGHFGSYGNYVRIRHSNGYKTAYAHLKGFARGIKTGAHVSQGQTIAYVGMTGRATGPHLHYEVLVNDHQVNPMGIRVATGQQLKGKELAAFTAARHTLSIEMASAQQLGHTTTASIAAPGGTVQR